MVKICTALKAVLWRDLILAWRRLADMVGGIMFFIMIIILLPLSLPPELLSGESTILATVAPAMLWMGLMLATLPQMERLFSHDASSGALDQLLLTPAPLPLIVLTKAIAAWLTIGLPLSLIAPLLGLMLGLPLQGMGGVMLSLAIGSFGLQLLGMMAAALTLGARQASVLIALLTLPLATPLLIFGVTASRISLEGGNPASSPVASLQLLGAVVVILLAAAPLATAMGLRQAAE